MLQHELFQVSPSEIVYLRRRQSDGLVSTIELLLVASARADKPDVASAYHKKVALRVANRQ